jgi:phosphoenolpyruvate carboxykinase (GTP)
VARLEGTGAAVRSPIGMLPAPDAIDVEGLDVPPGDLRTLLTVDPAVWLQEADLIAEHYERFGARLPDALHDVHRRLVEELRSAS